MKDREYAEDEIGDEMECLITHSAENKDSRGRGRQQRANRHGQRTKYPQDPQKLVRAFEDFAIQYSS